MNYYVYEYLREDGSPYYVGKGINGRWYSPQHNVNRPPKERVRFVAENLTEQEAHGLEIELIARYGRKDIGTGILRNLTDGGEGSSGRPATEQMRKKISETLMGREQSEETKKKRADALRGQTRTEEQRQRLSNGAKKRWANVDNESEEARRAKIKEARSKQDMTQRKVECPHCGKIGGHRNMARYHFDNCKRKEV
jgi:hypothetical protein